MRNATRAERVDSYAEFDEEANDRVWDAVEPTDHGFLKLVAQGVVSWFKFNLIAVPIAVGVVAILWYFFGRQGWAIQIGGLVGIVGAYLVRKLMPRREEPLRGLAAEGICPACEYRFGKGKIEPDGCVVCSECGGAWRVKVGRERGDRES